MDLVEYSTHLREATGPPDRFGNEEKYCDCDVDDVAEAEVNCTVVSRIQEKREESKRSVLARTLLTKLQPPARIS